MNNKGNVVVIGTLIAILVLALAIFIYFYWMQPNAKEVPITGPGAQETQIANPASVYCADEAGGELKMYENELGVAGYCQLPNGNICEEWALFRSEGANCVEPTGELSPVEP